MEATRINAIGVPWRASAQLPEPAQNGSARVLPTVPVAQRHTADRHHLGTDPQSIIGWLQAHGSLLEILAWLRQHQEDVRAYPAGAGARYAANECMCSDHSSGDSRRLEVQIGDDWPMTRNGSEIGPPLTARVLEVPLTADGVAPPRLVYGGLELPSDTDGDDGYAALYFPVADSGALGRVTFEGLDAIRAARGEMLPYDLAAPQAAGDWVFIVDDCHPGWQNAITTKCDSTQHRCWTPTSTMPSGFMTSSPRPSRKESGSISLTRPDPGPGRPGIRWPSWTPAFPPGLSGLLRASTGSCGALLAPTLTLSAIPGCAPNGSTSSTWCWTDAAVKGPASGCGPGTGS